MKKDNDHALLSKTHKILLEDIERYFNCELTDSEEKDLKRRISQAGFSHPLLDEAKAVIGYTTLAASAPSKQSGTAGRFHPGIKRLAGIAAAIAVAVVSIATIKGLIAPSASSDRCFAYVNGTRIEQEDAVLEIIYGDMRELNDALELAQEDIAVDMDALAPTAETFSSQFDPIL